MSKGISIHVGINHVSREHYRLSLCLPHCCNDAGLMEEIALQNGFDTSLLLDEDATSYNFFYLLNKASAMLVDGDLLFISFSGHGTNFRDLNGDEEDGYDEALVFYDRIVIDDELHLAWTYFQPGVRILFISDSCNSGTVTKDIYSLLRGLLRSRQPENVELPDIFKRHELMYTARFRNLPEKIKTPVHCSVLLISACQDDQVAGAGAHQDDELSTFTSVLASCWCNGRFNGNYRHFYQEIIAELKQRNQLQRPNYYFIGKPNHFFEGQIPFTI